MSIAKIMSTRLISVSRHDTVGRMHEILEKLPIHHLLVVEDGHLLGLVSDRDVLRNISPFANTKAEDAKDRFTLQRQAHQIMNSTPATIKVCQGIRDAASIMVENNVGLLPVLDENEDLLIGVLSWKDVMRFIVD
jgi:acetoin utilization protein AcuB